MNDTQQLPRFTEYASCAKHLVATADDVRKVFVQPITLKTLKDAKAATVLDFGCGNGVTAAALRARGYSAYGVEIVESYIRNARDILPETDTLGPVLSLLDTSGRSVFSQSTFDAVVSDQVFEHVENLHAVASEIARVLKPGGISVHTFPAAHTLIEPHIGTPIVHWLPAGRFRRLGIGAAVKLGLCVKHHADRNSRQQAMILNRFTEEETFYRPLREIAGIFRSYGMCVRTVNREKLIARGGTLGRVAELPLVGDLGAAIYGTFFSVSIVATKL